MKPKLIVFLLNLISWQLQAQVTLCPGVTLTTNYGPATCYGQPRQVSLTVTGASYLPLYNWVSDNDGNATRILAPGTYQVQVWIPYQAGCPTAVNPYVHTVQIVQPTKVDANASIKNLLSCKVSELPNGPDGVLEVVPTGGTNVFQYWVDWDYNPASPAFVQGDFEREATSPGTYFVAVKDDNGCLDRDTISMPGTASIGFAVYSASSSCNVNGGGFTLQANNAQSAHFPLVFSLLNPSDHTDTLASQIASNSPPSATFTGLSNGTYFATVTDQAGCHSGGNYGINIAGQMDVSILRIEKSKCLNGSDGDVTVHRTGGTGPWTITFLNPDGSTFHTRSSWMGNNVHAFRDMFHAGNYSVFVKDNNSCYSDTIDFTVGDTLAGLSVSAFQLSTVTTFPYCHNQGSYSNAEIKMQASGGVTPYMYGVVQDYVNYNGQLWPDFNSSGWHAQNVLGEFYHLPYTNNGRWTVAAQDAVGCDIGQRLTIGISPPMVLSLSSLTNVDCNTNSTGAIQASISGGEGSIVYALNPGGASNSTGNFTNLTAKQYIIQATDTNGCYSNQLFVDVQQPDKLEARITSVSNPSCNPGTGWVNYTIRGGTLNYSVLIDGTVVRTISNNTTTSQWSTGGIGQGTHTFKVVDANGCQTDTVFTVTGPPTPGAAPNTGTTLTVVNPPATTNVDCYGNSSGEIDLSISGGWPASGGYTIDVDKIITYVDRFGITRSTSNRIKTTNSPTISGLEAGSYRIYVRDSYGCNRVVTTTITEPSLIEPIFNGISGNCGGGASTTSSSVSGGVNLLDIVGGVPPYTYIVNGGTPQSITPNFFPNLTLSSLFMEITDATGCKVYFP